MEKLFKGNITLTNLDKRWMLVFNVEFDLHTHTQAHTPVLMLACGITL